MKSFALSSIFVFPLADAFLRQPAEVSNTLEENTGGDVNFVKYYADWCPHCRNIEPKWEAATKLWEQKGAEGDGVQWVDNKCYKEDGSDGSAVQQCKSAKIEFFPDIRLEFKNGEPGCVDFPANMGIPCPCPFKRPNGEEVKRCVFYNGAPRNGIDLVTWLQAAIGTEGGQLVANMADVNIHLHSKTPVQNFSLDAVCLMKDAPQPSANKGT